MKSIDALVPPQENDGTKVLNESAMDSSKLVEQLVGAVKEVSDVHAAATEKLVDKFTDVLKNGKFADIADEPKYVNDEPTDNDSPTEN